ncbi:site-specific recombinase XerD [Thiocapsa rosea]|uniref:Site-specific recombinase XerD n=1 Tax=Thiocapsa rosea TaxID=69360 RepID=A0A495VI01_9GAMM|nr:site-specific recombinase XerD [Thiocapsa rosea]
MLGTIAEGKSPAAEKRAIKAESVTLKEAFAEYLASRDLKPGTVHDYKRHMVESFPDWQDRRLTEITRDMVERKHAKLGERSEARANGAMRVLRAILNFAAGKYENANGQPIILDIPTKRLSATRRWYRVERRQTLIRPAQLPAWWSAVDALESETIRDYLRVLILTGLRRGECARLEWKDIDLEGRTLTAPDTKNRSPHTLPLSTYLVELFRRRSKSSEGSRFVFPVGPRRANKDEDGHLNDARHSMAAVAEASGVSFTPHDLRRTFITIAESLDIPAYALKRLLNHKSGADVTGGYLVIDTERLRDPMQRITDYILKAAGVVPSAEIVTLRAESA